jgi:hypothetical protein
MAHLDRMALTLVSDHDPEFECGDVHEAETL